jgi:plasmid stabilization system protein ParE
VNEILVSPAAEAEMDDIWLYVARESQSIEIASRVVDAITSKFGLLARYPTAGRIREDLEPSVRSFAADGYLIVYHYAEPDVVTILHIVARGRDLFGLYLQ